MKNIKKFLTIILTGTILAAAAVFPAAADAEEPTTIPVSEDTFVRCSGGVVYSGNKVYVDGETITVTDATKGNYNTGQVVDSGATLYTSDAAADNTGGRRRTYLKFDVGNDEKAKLQSASYIVLKMQVSSGDSTATLAVHGLDNKSFDTSILNYDGTVSSGLEEFRNEIASVTGVSVGILELDVTDYVKTQTDNTYAFKLISDKLLSFYSKEKAGDFIKPSLVAYSEVPADKSSVMDDAAALTVPDVVKEDFTLAVSGTNGTTINWTSNNSAIAVNGETGEATVTQDATRNIEVTLTAKVEKGSFSATRNFNVIVLSPSRMQVIGVTADTHVRCKKGDGTGDVDGSKDKRLYVQELGADGGGCLRRSYLKFAPSAADVAKLKDADRITLKLKRTGVSAGMNQDWESAVLNVHGLTGDYKTKWDGVKGLYYSTTSANGMDTVSTGLEGFSNVIASVTGVSEELELDVTDYVKSQTDGSYVFKIARNNGGLLEFYSMESAGNEPCLVAYDVADDLEIKINGSASKEISDGEAELSLTVYKNGAMNPEGIVLAALYDKSSGALKKIGKSQASGTIDDGASHTYTVTLDITDAKNSLVKVFLWKDLINIVPILPAIVVE